MGYYVSNLIGIRTGGVFAGDADVEFIRKRVAAIIQELRPGENNPDIADDPSHCMSKELVAHKGGYVVIAGVFNFWSYDRASVFAARLSKDLETWVMHMSWDEEQNTVQCNVYDEGRPILDADENPIGKVLRRVT